jgi:hypothetical protein
MGGFLLTTGATVLCSHGGRALAASPNAGVTVNGSPTVLLSSQWTVAGCPLAPPPLPPCVAAQWITGSRRVTSMGQPLAISTGEGVSFPAGTPLICADAQVRVTAV